MNLLHVALASSSEEKADRFYRDLLGLRKSARRVLPAALSWAIFGIDSEMVMINYMDGATYFEIFVQEDCPGGGRRIDHVCLELENTSEFVEKCRSAGVNVTQVPKGESIVTFISDYDGNLFEIKQK